MSLLGISIPILQAPIGPCAGIELAAAVSEAGGLGALALAWTPPETAHRMVTTLRQRIDKPFQVNFVLAFEPHALQPALAAGAPIVTFSWGQPKKHVALVRSYGAKYGVQVSTRDGARMALDDGADFLVCQGVEAGGHVQATQPLGHVLPQVIEEAGRTPVVAAGGIASGADIAAVLRLGAAGALLGTRFVASAESLAHDAYKQLLVESRADRAALTLCFDLGWPYAAHRVLRNRTLERWEAAGCAPTGARPGEGDVVASTPSGKKFFRYESMPALRGMEGNVNELCLYAGQGLDRIDTVLPAAELVSGLWRDCLAVVHDGDA